MVVDFNCLLDATLDEPPVPIIRTKEILDSMSPGEILKLIAGKEGTVRNIRTFVANNQCELLSEFKCDDGFVFMIKKL